MGYAREYGFLVLIASFEIINGNLEAWNGEAIILVESIHVSLARSSQLSAVYGERRLPS